MNTFFTLEIFYITVILSYDPSKMSPKIYVPETQRLIGRENNRQRHCGHNLNFSEWIEMMKDIDC